MLPEVLKLDAVVGALLPQLQGRVSAFWEVMLTDVALMADLLTELTLWLVASHFEHPCETGSVLGVRYKGEGDTLFQAY